MKPSKNKRKTNRSQTESNPLTLEELYNDFGIIPDFDESKECYYIEDPDTDEMLTPCLSDEYALIDYINEHWDEIGERLEQIREKIQDMPDEADRAKVKVIKPCHKKKKSKKTSTEV